MPMADKATIKPTNTSNARVALLAALRKDNSPPVAERNNRASMPEDTHKVSTITATAVNTPSITVRSVSVEWPTFQPMVSSSFIKAGNSPLIHSAKASHTAQDTVCSSARARLERVNAICKTLTVRRISASAIKVGKASWNKASGIALAKPTRASSARHKTRTGNSAPSISCAPNSTERPASKSAPAKRCRIARTSHPLSTQQAKSAATSQATDTCKKALNQVPRSSKGSGEGVSSQVFIARLSYCIH